jgi:hypothetical protein
MHARFLGAALIALSSAVLAVPTSATAQQIPAYSFAQFPAAYGEIGDGTVHTLHPADDAVFNDVPIGFNFFYDGVGYSTVSISTNGWIRFGGNAVANEYFPISSTNAGTANSVSGLAANLIARTSTPTGVLRSITLGDIGSRQFVVQWKDFRRSGGTSSARVNMQIILVEGTNQIAIVYGPFVPDSAFWNAQVGLKGANNASFRNVSVTAAWADAVPGTANNATCQMTTQSSGVPVEGQLFLFSPPVPPVFSVGSASVAEGTSGGTVTLNVPVTISQPNPSPMSIQYSTLDGTARAGSGDFTRVTNGTLNIPSSATSALIPITVASDPLPEGDESFEVVISNPSAGSIGVDRATVTIEDDDYTCFPPEGFGTAVGTTPPAGWANVDLNAGQPALWQFNTPTTCNPSKTRVFQAPIALPFAIYDSDACGTAAPNEETALVTPAVDFSSALVVKLRWDEIYKGLTGIVAAVEVTTNNGLDWTTVAMNGASDSGNPATGVPASREFDVTDLVAGHASVRFRFRWRGDFGYYWIVDNVTVCTGNLPGGTSIVSINPGAVAEANASQSNVLSIPVTITPANASTITVGYTISNGTAVSGVDFSGPLTGSLSIVPPATSGNILIPTIGNDQRENPKTFAVALDLPLSGPAFVGNGEATATILNDDPIPDGFLFGIDNKVPSTSSTANNVFEFSPITLGGSLRTWGPANATAYAGGDFMGNDFSKFFAIDVGSSAKLVTVDTLTLQQTTVGPITVDPGEKARGLAWDRVSGSMYVLSTFEPVTAASRATIYRINPLNGGIISKVDFNQPAGATFYGLFVRPDGVFFTVDPNSERLFRLNRTTGAATPINFYIGAQLRGQQFDGDFNDATGLLYLAAQDKFSPNTNRLYLIDSAMGSGASIQSLTASPFLLGQTTALGIAQPYTSPTTAATDWAAYE